jgi:hypothetical protein
VARAGIDVSVVVDEADEAAVRRLASDLDRLELLETWVSAASSRTADPSASDDALAAVCDGSPTLVPVPVLVPPTGRNGAFDRAVRVAEAAERRLVRLCPAGHRYPLVDWVLSPLPELCQRAGIALLLDFEGWSPPWVEIVAFARSYPSLPMVVLGAEARDRAAPAALDAALNLIVALTADDPELIETFGTARFVWSAGGHAAAPRGLGEPILHENARALASGTYAERHL